MKKLSLLIAVTICNVVFAQTSPLKSSEKLKINTSKSIIQWSGEYAFYFGGHDGVINFKEGYFLKSNGLISGGEFVIDMNSIKSLDMDNEEARTGLDNHLKNEDFFAVANYPTAKLILTEVTYENKNRMKIYAELSIKEVTRPINFFAEVDYEKETLSTQFKIDRTLWNINYNSKEVEGKLKDGLISDAIGFEVTLSL